MKTLYIVLPAYNEELSIDNLFPSLQKKLGTMPFQYRILVCNDGSSDRTEDKLKEYSGRMPLEILTHKRNRGLGETMRDLFERAAELSEDGDVILRMDCDDTHEPQYIDLFLKKIEEGYDVVTASRFAPGGGQKGVSRYRAFVSCGATYFMRLLLPVKGLREYTCGFRAYRASIIKKALQTYGNNFIQLKGLGFTCTLEKVVKLNLLKARFAEIPFVLRYDKKNSPSKMISSITTLGYLTMLIMNYWPWGGWLSQAKKKTRWVMSS